MKRSEDLEYIFGNAQLEPRPDFTRTLAGQIGLSGGQKKRKSFRRRVAFAGAVLVIAVALVALPLARPAPKQLARTVLLKQLYATAMADELPKQSAVTFWDITQTDSGGPAMTACNSSVSRYTEHDLLFMKDGVTAAWIKGSDSAADMEYSDDADVPAFDTDVLGAAKNSQISWALDHGTLTNANGKPLPAGASTAAKSVGTYEVYATYPTYMEGTDTPVASCPTRLMDIKIDAASGLFTEVSEYNGTIAANNLIDKIQQSVKTGTGDFAAEEPKFDAVGFNLDQAKLNSEQNVSKVVNQAGGYEFWYRKSFFGEPTLAAEKDTAGNTEAYTYTFAAQPDVQYRLYTADSGNLVPKDLAGLKSEATANGWQVLDDETQHDIQFPGYAAADTELYEVSDGTTEYIMYATGTSDIPYVYIQAPLGIGNTDSVNMLSTVMLFTPGTTPPVPEG